MGLERQVNIWRGNSTPPTIYHIWVYDNSKLLLFDGTEWVVFIDDITIIENLNRIEQRLTELESNYNELGNKTVNSKPIKDNPVLHAGDLKTNVSGTFISNTDTIQKALENLDLLFDTQIIE